MPSDMDVLGELGTYLLRGPRYWEYWGAIVLKGLCDWEDGGPFTSATLRTGSTGVWGIPSSTLVTGRGHCLIDSQDWTESP